MNNHLVEWPVLTRYEGDGLDRVALPLGGIGTGTISLGGRGNLHDWELRNRPAKGFTPAHAFFALHTQTEDGASTTRALEGPLPIESYQGPSGCKAPQHGLPRFRECAFEAAYPLGQVLLRDPDVPVAVRLQAFNPLIPADADRSGLPLAVLRFVLTNLTDGVVRASVCGNAENFIGQGAVNNFKNAPTLRGIALSATGLAPDAEGQGNFVMATTATDVSYRTAWPQLSWGDAILNYWDDFSGDGRVDEITNGTTIPVASLCAAQELNPGASVAITFLLGWHFPNRLTWNPWAKPGATEDEKANYRPEVVGNYYATQFDDAWAVALYGAANLDELEADTIAFVSSFIASDLPHEVKEAALYNLSTLRSETCFRTPDGRFYGWEGCEDTQGSCNGNCTHVWNYEQATAFLFGDLARSMREVEFAHATNDNGLMSFRTFLPLERAREMGGAAADGQMGCLMKLYRDWQLSGDEAMLRDLWPKARKTLEFCWIPGGWDADCDGVMEGCQHNSMDVEYYGPNPQMGLWYLGALRACEEMAAYLGEASFAARCRELFDEGSNWIDRNLFNGEYYEHHIRPITNEADIASGLRIGMGAADLANPELQLGAGCLVDQLVGQYMAHICGLGYLVSEENIRKTLRALMQYNYKDNLWSHFNHRRTYALADESAMLMATYPRGRRPERPFPYFNEVMTGFEYTAAVHMLYEGMEHDGLKLIRAIRARYDGHRRSPFDEAECGHHYARAMASWGAVTALTGFRYSAVTGTMRFAQAERDSKWFWSNGNTWGTFEQRPHDGGLGVRLDVLGGNLSLRTLHVGDRFSVEFSVGSVDLPGKSFECDLQPK